VTDQDANDWCEAGCARDCSEQHTYEWGRCAHAPESAKPTPTISILRVEESEELAKDIVAREIPLTAWDALITVAKWVSRGRSFAFDAGPDIAPAYPDTAARYALGALDDAGLLDRKEPTMPTTDPELRRLAEQRSLALDYLETLTSPDIHEGPRTRLLKILDDGRLNGPECGKTLAVSGTEYPPCARPAGHHEAYCRDASRNRHFLAAERKSHP
jgi:hypothetical protein